MPKNEYKADKEKQRRKNRRFNLILYIIAALFILVGLFVILRDQTYIFTRNSGERPNVTFPPRNTFSPETAVPTDPGPTGDALPTEDPGPTWDPWPTGAPLPTDDPGPTGGTPTQEPTVQPTYPPWTTPAPWSAAEKPPSPPVNIYFEGYDISVKVVPVGIDDKGQMASVPKYNIAGWYMYGACPNEEGNCIIAGHNRYGGIKGLFAILHDKLKVGDAVIVTLENGDYVFYEVISVMEYRYDAVPDFVMDTEGEARLTLITCLGDYSHTLHMSRTRVVAVCRPIKY
ncbi:MAG: sortase [Clostridiales bacterium]|nr:sortase [Clostridiales bacterium]